METQENLIDLLDRAADFDSEHVNAKRVKFWLDGAPLPPQYLPFPTSLMKVTLMRQSCNPAKLI